MSLAEDRKDAIKRIFDDLPPVHAFGIMSHAPAGVWHTDRSLYEWMATFCDENMATLETGCGVSTVLFAMWGTAHTCVTPSAEEVSRVTAYCESRGISLDRVAFKVGFSDDVLPAMTGEHELDLVLVDGGHAFPLAIIDWYYAASRLKTGGLMIIDDLQLASVSTALLPFLERDRRWQRLRRDEKWAAYHRLSSGPLRDEWGLQVGLGIYDHAKADWSHRGTALAREGATRARSLARRLASRTPPR